MWPRPFVLVSCMNAYWFYCCLVFGWHFDCYWRGKHAFLYVILVACRECFIVQIWLALLILLHPLSTNWDGFFCNVLLRATYVVYFRKLTVTNRLLVLSCNILASTHERFMFYCLSWQHVHYNVYLTFLIGQWRKEDFLHSCTADRRQMVVVDYSLAFTAAVINRYLFKPSPCFDRLVVLRTQNANLLGLQSVCKATYLLNVLRPTPKFIFAREIWVRRSG